MTVAQAFQSQVYPQGLHLERCKIPDALGTFDAEPNATFRQGQLVQLSSDGKVQLATDGLNILGVSKWTKDVGYGNAVAVDEPIVLTGTDVTSLARGSIVGTSALNNTIKVSLTPGGAALTPGAGNDYVVDSLANGTIHRLAGGAIGDGDTVYVTYTYALNGNDEAFQGTNFWGKHDDVTIQAGKIAVIMNHAILFTTEYASNRRYVMNDALYCGKTDTEDQGKFTNDGGEGNFVGKVIQVPTADDPWLGLEFRGQFTE